MTAPLNIAEARRILGGRAQDWLVDAALDELEATRAELVREDRSHSVTLAERDKLHGQIDEIADALGDETEWSNLNDRGDEAIALAQSLIAERDELAEVKAAILTCEHCGKRPATCLGNYENHGKDDCPDRDCSWHEDAYACDACCEHTCEEGWCMPLADVPGLTATLDINLIEALADRDAARAQLADMTSERDDLLALLDVSRAHGLSVTQIRAISVKQIATITAERDEARIQLAEAQRIIATRLPHGQHQGDVDAWSTALDLITALTTERDALRTAMPTEEERAALSREADATFTKRDSEVCCRYTDRLLAATKRGG